jgi:hypothetical protein
MTAPTAPRDDLLGDQVADYRHVRERLERGVLAVATSLDGRAFEVQASLHDLALRRGGYVMLDAGEAGSRLGQITDIGSDSVRVDVGGGPGTASDVVMRVAHGQGLVLDSDGSAFHDARVRPAEPEEVGAWFARARPDRAELVTGELLLAPGVPAVLDSGGLDRHTFMCGQSGSGKTYSLGLLLERVLAETRLRVVVLDPNSDYVGLGRVRRGADLATADRYRDVTSEVMVWGDGTDADHRLRLQFAELDPAAQAATLRLDPIREREEYAFLMDLLHSAEPGKPLLTGLEQLTESDSRTARELGMRATNLGVLDWAIWDPHLPSLLEELRRPTTRCTVIDLGSLGTAEEGEVVAQAALATLWSSRLSREPCLIVIDEAHNICPADPSSLVTRLCSERAVQIAAEGRKYGLYLLTSTQRPHKVHQNVVSQCDNLLLMRMNSQADIAELSTLFSFVPPGLMAGASSFGLGQALVAGKVFPQSAYVQMGRRVSEEGGTDIPTSWAARRT